MKRGEIRNCGAEFVHVYVQELHQNAALNIPRHCTGMAAYTVLFWGTDKQFRERVKIMGMV